MNMNNDRDLLCSLLKTTQMGQIGIRSVLDAAVQPSLQKALQSQLQEYDAIESEAYYIASQRGWELKEVQPIKRIMADTMCRMKLRHGDTDSKIADMVIQGNTRGMITGLQDLHRYQQQDNLVSALSQRLLDCETANIRQMQAFL